MKLIQNKGKIIQNVWIKDIEQAGAVLGQAQLKLGLDFTSINLLER